jgi:hypothetical protein
MIIINKNWQNTEGGNERQFRQKKQNQMYKK